MQLFPALFPSFGAPLHSAPLRNSFADIAGTVADETWRLSHLDTTGRFTLSGGGGTDTLTLDFRSLHAVATLEADFDPMTLHPTEYLSCGGVELVLADDFDLVRIRTGDLGNSLGSNSWTFRVEMFGGSGNDQFWSGDGDDLLRAGAGDDMVMSANGNDMINVGDGNDTVYAGFGDDSVRGGDGADSILGHGGADDLRAGAGDDTVDGGADNDLVYGLAGADSITGGDGADYLGGGAGADTIDGGTGADTLIGAAGSDSLSGGDDADQINGGDDVDTLLGGAGNDTLFGGAGDDILTGGTGTDRFVFGQMGVDGTDQITDYVFTDNDVLVYNGTGIAGAAVSPFDFVATEEILPGSGSDMVADTVIRFGPDNTVVWVLTDTTGLGGVIIETDPGNVFPIPIV
ncbi:hemolysin type calcium-binding protein [Rhodobacter viridis]|uniref:Hemolysin type calcium-binding protein n=1 Tax=Rhodobacter viridis TaxID=1054202 RepID=A0A318TRB4_9RHOB|nr:calcium-binding protein [Rhodobacter viridis]PYF07134.1 hemolysin type calcium-binding protein [Rhodobacter viridis]